MLEVLRVLSKSQTPLKHAVIMNFNGAEEVVLQVRNSENCFYMPKFTGLG